VEKHLAEIEQLGGQVLAVSFTPAAKARPFLEKHPLSVTVLCDPNREAYRAFELGQTSWLRILNPLVLIKFLGIMLRGWLPFRPDQGEDLMQLGGDFVLDAQRRLVYSYRSADPADRPSAGELLQAVRKAAGQQQP
jgi:peroxiredoxin